MLWIKQTTRLAGTLVELIPLEEQHFAALELIAKEQRIFEFMAIDMSTEEKRNAIFVKAIEERDAGRQFPFVIYHRATQKIIGSTRLIELYPEHKKLEIGWTWLHPDHWAGGVNPECKLLLLNFCFETLKAVRVQLKTDALNLRSQKAIAKIGGVYEGTLRQDIIRPNGTLRDSMYFSILDKEWPEKKLKLEQLYLLKTAY